MERDSLLNSLEVFSMLTQFIDKNDLADHYMSFSYGVSLPKSDLDLVIVVSPDSLSQLVIFRFLKGLN